MNHQLGNGQNTTHKNGDLGMVYGFILPTLMVKSYNQYMVNVYIITMEIHIFH